jgi:stage III sporulation protein AB
MLEEKLIEKQIQKAEIEKSKNTKLYKSMGIIVGIGICIILI